MFHEKVEEGRFRNSGYCLQIMYIWFYFQILTGTTKKQEKGGKERKRDLQAA